MNKIISPQQTACRISVSRLISGFCVAWWLLATVGCTLNEIEEGRVASGEKMEAQFNLSVSKDNAPRTRSCKALVTRAGGLTEMEEDTLVNLCVVQYDEKGIQTSKPVYYDKLAYTTDKDGLLVLDFVLDRNTGTNTVYLLANVGNQVENLIGTEDGFKTLRLSALSALTNQGMPLNDQCVMVGSWTGKLTDQKKKVSMTRIVAKISFSYEVVPGKNSFSFIPTTLKLRNVPQQIQYIESQKQLSEIGYAEYNATGFDTSDETTTSGSYCWYLPENPAGIAEGEGIATSEKDKRGVGVSNATYIELTGDVTQDGVSYSGVVFELYPGSLGNTEGYNDYNINRNSSHNIHILFEGIDFSDRRFTITAPPMANPDMFAVGIGDTALFRISAHPGTPWSFTLPDWLSAKINDNPEVVAPLSNISHYGSAELIFTTTSVNPGSTFRNFVFKVDKKAITLTQDKAVVVANPTTVSALPTDELVGTFTATSGLPWRTTVVEGKDWISVVQTDKTTTGESQEAGFTTTQSNPSATPRQGIISVRAGDIYQGPVANIVVTQEGFLFSPSSTRITVPTKGSDTQLTIDTHDGEPWTVAYASGDENIQTDMLGGEGSGSVTFKASENKGAARYAVFTFARNCIPRHTFNVTVRQDPVVPFGSNYNNIQLAPKTTTTSSYNWADAMIACENLSVDGFERGSWHLPTRLELGILYSGLQPPCSYHPDYMPRRLNHWSSDSNSQKDTEALMVHLSDNTPTFSVKTTMAYVRCVRKY